MVAPLIVELLSVFKGDLEIVRLVAGSFSRFRGLFVPRQANASISQFFRQSL